MIFIVDAQLPPLLATWLRSKGHEAFAVRDVELRDASDRAIWERASERAAIIVTKDEDFARLAAASSGGPQILWVRTGNVLNRALIARFESVWPEVSMHLVSSARVIEIR